MVYSLLILFLLCGSIIPHQFTQEPTEHGTKIVATIDADDANYLYKEFIDVQSDHPDLTINQWHIQDDAMLHFDTSFKEEKKISDVM